PRLRTARRLAVGAGVLALSLGLAACGSGSPSGSEEDTTSAGTGSEATSGDLTSITVGAIPLGDVAPIHVGFKESFFDDEVLDVEVGNTWGGDVDVRGVVGGDDGFAIGSTVSIMVALDQGAPLEYMANGTTTTGEEGKHFAAVNALEDSELETSADLQGH